MPGAIEQPDWPGEPDPATEGKVWFCQQFGQVTGEKLGAMPVWSGGPWFAAGLTEWHLVIVGVMVFAAVFVLLGRTLGLAYSSWVYALAAVSVLAMAWGVRAAWRGYLRNRHVSKLPFGANTAYRVQCALTDPDRDKLGEIADQAFEVEVFNLSFSLATRFCPAWSRWAGWAAAIGAVCLGSFLVTGRVFPSNIGMLWIEMLGAAGLYLIGMGVAWPVYARIVPGRIDLVHTGFLGQRASPLIHSFDLGRARVWVNLRTGFAFVDAGHRGVWVSMATAGKFRFARMLLLAAVSTAGAPELPREELVG